MDGIVDIKLLDWLVNWLFDVGVVFVGYGFKLVWVFGVIFFGELFNGL